MQRFEAVGDTAEDDIAPLVLRAHPEDQPRPAVDGPAQAAASVL